MWLEYEKVCEGPKEVAYVGISTEKAVSASWLPEKNDANLG